MINQWFPRAIFTTRMAINKRGWQRPKNFANACDRTEHDTILANEDIETYYEMKMFYHWARCWLAVATLRTWPHAWGALQNHSPPGTYYWQALLDSTKPNCHLPPDPTLWQAPTGTDKAARRVPWTQRNTIQRCPLEMPNPTYQNTQKKPKPKVCTYKSQQHKMGRHISFTGELDVRQSHRPRPQRRPKTSDQTKPQTVTIAIVSPCAGHHCIPVTSRFCRATCRSSTMGRRRITDKLMLK